VTQLKSTKPLAIQTPKQPAAAQSTTALNYNSLSLTNRYNKTTPPAKYSTKPPPTTTAYPQSWLSAQLSRTPTSELPCPAPPTEVFTKKLQHTDRDLTGSVSSPPSPTPTLSSPSAPQRTSTGTLPQHRACAHEFAPAQSVCIHIFPGS
jgi:hypothetical protein